MVQGPPTPALYVENRAPRTAFASEDRLPVVLVHGWASASSYWEPLAERLLDAGHTVWIVDLPGYHPGEVLPEGFEWTLDSAADAGAAGIHSRRGRKAPGAAQVVGHGLGGSVALTLAARRPGSVATLTLVGMVPAPPNQGFRVMLTSQLEQGFIDAGTRDRCMAAWFGSLEQEDKDRLSRGFNVPFDVLGPSGLAGMRGVDPGVPGRVTAPTLVIVGIGDRLRSRAQVEEFVAGSPLRRLAAIPDAGHSVHWE